MANGGGISASISYVMDEDHELKEIERTLWANDADIYHRTFLSDAVIIFPEVGRIDLESALDTLREENAVGRRWAEVAFSDPASPIGNHLSASRRLGRIHHTTSTPYFRNTRSRVTRGNRSARAWATSRRSNGSR